MFAFGFYGFSQEVSKDSIFDSNGIKINSYIQYDILNEKDYIILGQMLMYNSQNFDSIDTSYELVKQINNLCEYKKKQTNIFIKIEKLDKDYEFKVFKNKRQIVYKRLKLKNNYELKLTKIKYPFKGYKFYTLYFKSYKIGDEKKVDYISIRLEVKNLLNKSFFNYYL